MLNRRQLLFWLAWGPTGLGGSASVLADQGSEDGGGEDAGPGRSGNDGDNDEDDRDDGPDKARSAVDDGRAAPLLELLEIVARRYPGEVVGVKFRARGDDLLYRVKILDRNGRLTTVTIDAASKRILEAGTP